MKRQFSKTPEPPKELTPELCQLLTNLCFGTNLSINKTDLIFVYGTPFFLDEIAEHVANLLQNNVATNVLITGGIVPNNDYPTNQEQSEARSIYDRIITRDYPKKIDFFLEETSTNALANVVNGLKIIDFSNYNSLCFVFPSHGAKRGYLTLRKFLSHTQILQSSYDVTYPGEGHSISKDNWHSFEFGIRRVWGEFLRIKEYGSRGDIAYEEVKDLVTKIDFMVS